MTQISALLQKGDGYSGTSEGPAIADASEYLEYARVDLPPLANGQVRLKIRMAAVNPSDLHFIKGEYGTPRSKGRPAGFEAVGDVVAGNGDYAKSLIGQRVSFVVTPDGSGTWAEEAITNAANCIPLRPDLKDEDAAGLVVNPLTAMAMIERTKAIGTDSFIMSAANSQLCKLMISLGRDEGLAPICLIRDPKQKAHLIELGAAEVINSNDTAFPKTFEKVSRDLKPRVFLDAVSNQVSADVFAAMPNRAHWIVYGKLDPTPPVMHQMGQFVFQSKVIEGFWLTQWFQVTPRDLQIQTIAKVQERFATGAWRTEITARLALRDVVSDLPKALKTGGKTVISP